MVSDEPRQGGQPRQASLRRLRRFGVRPNRELGQNFLIDDNILGVIGRAAEVGPRDVVLEVGGGLGVLSEYLAARAAHLHVIEVDESLRSPLEEALAPFDSATLHLADAAELDFGTLEPSPSKVVANLPYGVAATVLLKSIAELPEARLWVAMVQLEVAQRLAANPGGKAYGATSVLAQLACEVKLARRVPRTVFHPEPNVESALVQLRRRGPAATAELSALVHAGFAHRRKALPGSLALVARHAARVPGAEPRSADRAARAPAIDPRDLRDAARTALAVLGLPQDARAERLLPADWARLAEALGPEWLAELRPR